MVVHIISSKDNISVAQKILSGISNVVPFFLDGSDEDTSNERKSVPDCFITVVDESFINDNSLLSELNKANEYANMNEMPIYSIILNGAQAPEQLKYRCCINVDQTDGSIAAAQKQLNDLLRTDPVSFKSLKQKKRNKTKALPVLAIGLVIFSIAIYFFLETFGSFRLLYIFPAIGFFIGAIALILSFMRLLDERREQTIRIEDRYYKELESKIVSGTTQPSSEANLETEKTIKKDEINALGLMQVNLSNIEKYYKWSQQQARSAFTLAVWMCIVGLLVFAVAVLLPTVFQASTEVAIITAIAGGIVELFAGTALVVYKSSVEQLNYYHKALHEDERFLSSVNLLGEFSEDGKKDEVLHEIIKSEISMNTMSYDNANQDKQQRQRK